MRTGLDLALSGRLIHHLGGARCVLSSRPLIRSLHRVPMAKKPRVVHVSLAFQVLYLWRCLLGSLVYPTSREE